MGCPSERELTRFVQRELSELDSERIRDHLDECDPCRLGIVAGLSQRATAPAAGLAPELAGTRLGPFELVGRLGAGGMGTVYEAIDRRIDRAVALKLVRGDQARLLDEARAMAGVRHPSVLTVFEAGELDGSVYLATELIRGATLRSLAPGRRALLAMYRRAAEGLAAAHRHGLIHRDFKPANVLVEDGTGRVLVADFGLATALGSGGVDHTGAVVEPAGTPAYMAPEQIDGEPLDAAVDVFAFAVSLWEALVGARPFAGATLVVLREAMRTPPRPPRQIPRALRGVLVRCLAEAPAARPALSTVIDALAPRRRAAIALGIAGVAVVGVAAAVEWPRGVAPEAACASTPTPAQVTSAALARASIPAWVRARVAPRLAARDREVVELQRRTCATGDEDARRAWIACRGDHAIEEAALVSSLAVPWPAWEHLDEALELAWPSTCTSRAARLEAALVPSEPTLRATLDAAKRDLARAEIAWLAGRPVVVASDGPLAPERQLFAARRVAASAERAALLTAAVELAEREAHVTTAAKAWLELAIARSLVELDSADARALALRQASWAIDRAGDPPMLRARWHALAAETAWDHGDLQGEQDHAKAAAALAGDDPHRQRLAVRALAHAAGARADFTAQRALLESLAPALEGATDLDAARFHTSYGECLYQLGDLAPARREADLGVALARANVGDRDPLTAEALLVRGFVELDQGDPAASARTVDEVIAIFTAALGRDHVRIGAALNLRCSARSAVEDWPGALADAEAAEALFVRRYGAHGEPLIFARTQIGALLAEMRSYPKAREVLEGNLVEARATYGAEDPRTADVERALAGVLVKLGQPAAARPLLEHAVAAQQHAHHDPLYVAQGLAELARLNGDRALARQVLALWKGQANWIKESAELETWLTSAR